MADTDKRALLKALETKFKDLPNVKAKSIMAELSRLMDIALDLPDAKGMSTRSEIDSTLITSNMSPDMHKQVQEVISLELEHWMKTRLPMVMEDTMKALNTDDENNPPE